MNKQFITHLKRHRACPGAVEWAETQETPEQAWTNCKRGDWMAWYIAMIGAAGKPWSEERKRFVLAMCKCMRLALRYVPAGNDRLRKAILTAKRWTRDKATKEEVKITAGAAWATWVPAAAWAAWAAGASGAKMAEIIRRYYPEIPRRRK